MRVFALQAGFVDDIPEPLLPATIYVSVRHATAVHLCACGCGNEVVTPIDRCGWTLGWDGASVSLHPSVGSWSLPCRSHYLVRHGEVVWLPPEPERAVVVPRAGAARRLLARLTDLLTGRGDAPRRRRERL